MNRRHFFGLVAVAAPTLFLPKLIKPGWPVRSLPIRATARKLTTRWSVDEAKLGADTMGIVAVTYEVVMEGDIVLSRYKVRHSYCIQR